MELLLVTFKFDYSLFLKRTFQTQDMYFHTILKLIHNYSIDRIIILKT